MCNNDAVVFFLLKIMENKYIESFVNGNVYFSCCKRWINIEKSGGKSGQGDIYEGVFAKYKKSNSRKPKQYYRKKFGKDLEVLSNDNYVLFRRRSSLMIPATCFYSFDSLSIIDFLPAYQTNRICELIEKNSDKDSFKIDNFPFIIPRQYLEEFNISSKMINSVIIQPRDFLSKLKEHSVVYRKVKYIDMSDEFDIFKSKTYQTDFNMQEAHALNEHIEIFYKDKNKFAHQNELRAVIKDKQLSSLNSSITIKLSGLKSISAESYDEKSMPINVNGFDFLFNSKNIDTYATVEMVRIAEE